MKTLTTTSMLERLGQIYAVHVEETGVGMKFVAPKMRELDASGVSSLAKRSRRSCDIDVATQVTRGIWMNCSSASEASAIISGAP